MANVLALALVLIVIAAGDNRGIIMAGAHTPSSPNSSSSLCGASLASLTPCLGSLQSGVNNSTPTQGCCTALASAVDSSAVCVCHLFTTTNNPLGIPIDNISQGIPINQSGALNLPGACKITTPPVSQCKSPAGNLMDYLQKLAYIESQIVDLKNVIPLKKQRFSINHSIQKLPYIERQIGSSSVIVVGAGISGIVAAKVLAENGVEDFLILEAADRIGGRLMKHEFAGFTVECGAGWVAGVGGNKINPIWELANKYSVRTCYSDYSNAAFNIYDESGARVPGSVAAACYKLAVDSAHRALAIEATSRMSDGTERANLDLPSQATKIQEAIPLTPLELAIDYWLHDFEMAEVEPMPTYTEFGAREYMVSDDRGYEYIVHKLAQEFLESEGGHVVDDRLKMKKVVRDIQYTNDGVTIKVEDGSVYSGKYAIVSVSLGVLQSDLIKFNPPLHSWKRKAFFSCQMRVYTKIFLKFPSKFWPTGDGSEFFLYAHEKRGYYTFWQDMEAAYSGSNILVVTVTDEESKRIEEQGDDKTKAEAMAVLRKMFGDGIPEAEQILIPRWWNNRFQRGTYSNYPIFVNPKHFDDIKKPVGPVYFTGEHTSQKFSGYVHGAYLSGIDTAKMVIESMKNKQNVEQG